MSFAFRLIRTDEGAPAVQVFEASTSPGFVPLWEAVGVYDALYNSDGCSARDVSRCIAFGVDRISSEASLARLLPESLQIDDALRFLEAVNRACVLHAQAHIETR